MRRQPVPRDDRLIDSGMLGRVTLMVTSAVIVIFGWFAWRLEQGMAIELVRTETFTLLALSSVVQRAELPVRHRIGATPGPAAQPLAARRPAAVAAAAGTGALHPAHEHAVSHRAATACHPACP